MVKIIDIIAALERVERGMSTVEDAQNLREFIDQLMTAADFWHREYQNLQQSMWAAKYSTSGPAVIQ